MANTPSPNAGAGTEVPGPEAFQCANPACRAHLGTDHVTLVTTCHVRRFCSVECITEGHRLVLNETWEQSRA
jgi:hypothetical protein